MSYRTRNGIKFFYQILGEGKPLLFIHGLGSSTLDWQNQISFFSENYKTISIDLRGHGQSGSSDTAYSIKLFAEDIVSLLLEEKEPINIVGISMGGMVAFQLAVDHSEIVNSLVIINSLSEIPIHNKKVRKAIRIRKLVPRLFGMRIMGMVIGRKLFPKKKQIALRKLIAKRWALNSIENYTKSVNAIAGWSITKDLSKIKCPVLVLSSEFDYGSIEEKEKYSKKIPNANLKIIPDARHAVSMEKPEAVNKAISEFLETLNL